MGDDALLSRLREIVGTAHVRTEPALRAAAEVDWTGRWRGEACGVVRPGSTTELVGVVAACAEQGTAVVPQGGNTGLVGGAVPRNRAVVVATTRLDALGEVDPATRRVTVGAGATLAAVQTHAGRAGLAPGVDLAARDTATIGGMIATNAGGVQVVAHGMMRAHVAGLTAVLADGTVLDEQRGLDKDNTGYDLAGLLVGSEGTLGLVTQATLRLVRPPAHRATALLPRTGLDEAVAALPALRAARDLEAVEWVDRPTAELVRAHAGLDRVAGEGPWLLAEVGGDDDPTAALAEALADVGTAAEPAAVATEPGERAQLWRHREAATEAVAAEAARTGHPVRKLDVAVPPRQLPDFAEELPTAVAAASPGARVLAFGHVGDGNLHVQLLDVPDERCEPCEDAVFERVVARGGSISAEHGIGVAKRRWLERARSPEAVAAMRAVKRALDPSGRLNPGVLVEP